MIPLGEDVEVQLDEDDLFEEPTIQESVKEMQRQGIYLEACGPELEIII